MEANPTDGQSDDADIVLSLSTTDLDPGTYAVDCTVDALAAGTVVVTVTCVVSPPPWVIVSEPHGLSVPVNAAITAKFSEAMEPSSIGVTSFFLKYSPPPLLDTVYVTGTVEYNSADSTATLTLDTDLAYDTDYTAVVKASVTDTFGNPMAADHSWSFTTQAASDLTSPTVIAATPLGADAPLDALITATFSEPMKPSTIASNFSLAKDGVGEVGGVVTYDSGSNKATFSPTSNLSYGADYTATITTGVKDLADNPMLADYTWQFSAEPLIPGPVSGFILDEPNGGRADWNTTILDFEWETLDDAGVTFYRIFARDNKLNTDWVEVHEEAHLDHLTHQSATIELPDDFDAYSGDGIQTPFSNGTTIEFHIRAFNPDGIGPSATVISIKDETPPAFNVSQGGVADNATRAEDTTFAINFTQMEYVDSVHFVFSEAGGDPAFLFTESDVTWKWSSDMRGFDTVYVTVPAGKTGSADHLTVNVWDNSGNMGSDTMSLTPWIVVDMPNDTTTNFMAPNYNVEWTSTDPNNQYDWLDILFSLDGGTTWLDSVAGTADDGSQMYDIDDTLFSPNALIAIQDTAIGGGWMWVSEIFTWTGVKLTGPDAAWLDTAWIYDRGSADSTGVSLTWNYAGLDSVLIQYTVDGGAWQDHDTAWVSGGTGSYTFYPPNRGRDYICNVRVANWDEGERPCDEIASAFQVVNDYVYLGNPSGGEVVAGGSDYAIQWDFWGDPDKDILLEYTVDSGATWLTISTAPIYDRTFYWAVPGNTYSNDSSWIRISDGFGNNVFDTSGTFSISGIVIDAPSVGTVWLAGTDQDIQWHTIGAPGLIDLWLSHDNFVTDSAIIAAGTVDDGVFTWFVSNSPDSSVYIRARTNTDTTYATTGPFLIGGLVLNSPNGGEVWTLNTPHNITWDAVVTDANVRLEYSSNGGGDWFGIVGAGSIPPFTGSFTWALDPMVDLDLYASTACWVRVSTASGPLVYDISDAAFEIR